MVRPKPRHSGQAPSGLLKLNSPGVGGRISRSQCAQCQPVEKGISDCGLRTADCSPRSTFGFRRSTFDVLLADPNEVDPVFPETQRRLDRLRPGEIAILFRDRDAILDDLNPRSESAHFLVGIGADDFAIQPDAQISLLLEKLEEIARFRFRRNRNPKGEQDRLARDDRATLHPRSTSRSRGESRARSSGKRRARSAARATSDNH